MIKKRLTYFVFFNVVLIGTVVLAITSFLWVSSLYEHYEKESERIHNEYVDKVRNELKNRVDTIVSFINYRKATTELLLQQDIRSRVHELHNLMQHLYLSNKDTLPEAQVKRLITEAVRALRYNNGRGYYFIDTLEGDVVLYPTDPENEGTNLFDLQDMRGSFPIRREIQLIKTHGQGFVEGYWEIPNDGSGLEFKKITFVQKFAPFNWYFGTGEYVDIVSNQMQEEIKSYINQLTYGDTNEQYVFVHDFEGTELANGLHTDLIGKNHFELEYSQGTGFIEKQIELAQTPPYHGFLTHMWPSARDGVEREKLTYVAAIPSWGWVVGSGADMTALNEAIRTLQESLFDQLMQGIINVSLIILTIFLLSLVVAKYVSRKINNSIHVFTHNLEQSSAQLSLIDEKKVEYQEFEELAQVSNNTTKQINDLLHKDELTGLYNRRYINVLLDQFLSKAQQENSELSILMLDVDHFKRINDTYGHQAGDEVLIQVAQAIEKQVEKVGYAGRFGGEEVLVILPDMTAQDTSHLAHEIKDSIEHMRLPDIPSQLTISGGISSGNTLSAATLIQLADANLYKAKENGRNRIEM